MIFQTSMILFQPFIFRGVPIDSHGSGLPQKIVSPQRRVPDVDFQSVGSGSQTSRVFVSIRWKENARNALAFGMFFKAPLEDVFPIWKWGIFQQSLCSFTSRVKARMDKLYQSSTCSTCWHPSHGEKSKAPKGFDSFQFRNFPLFRKLNRFAPWKFTIPNLEMELQWNS